MRCSVQNRPKQHVRHGRIQPCQAQVRHRNRRLRLPGTAYPAYSYVQYQDVAPYFQIASQYGYANYFSRPIRVPVFPRTSSSLEHFAGRQRLRTGLVRCEEQGGAGSGCLSRRLRASSGESLTQDLKTKTFPCFDHDTIVDVFAAATIPVTWTLLHPRRVQPMDGAQCDSGNLQPGGEELRGAYWTKGASNGFVDPTPPTCCGTSAIAI